MTIPHEQLDPEELKDALLQQAIAQRRVLVTSGLRPGSGRIVKRAHIVINIRKPEEVRGLTYGLDGTPCQGAPECTFVLPPAAPMHVDPPPREVGAPECCLDSPPAEPMHMDPPQQSASVSYGPEEGGGAEYESEERQSLPMSPAGGFSESEEEEQPLSPEGEEEIEEYDIEACRSLANSTSRVTFTVGYLLNVWQVMKTAPGFSPPWVVDEDVVPHGGYYDCSLLETDKKLHRKVLNYVFEHTAESRPRIIDGKLYDFMKSRKNLGRDLKQWFSKDRGIVGYSWKFVPERVHEKHLNL